MASQFAESRNKLNNPHGEWQKCEKDLTEEWSKGTGDVAESGLPLNSRRKCYTVYVGLLPLDVSKHDLAKLFQGAGPIREVYIATPAPSMRFTYAFVRFLEKDAAEKAVLDFQDWQIGGSRLKVEHSKESGEPSIRRERHRHKLIPGRKGPEDDLILWKVKQLCSTFNHKHAEFTRNFMVKNDAKDCTGPVISPVPHVDLPSLLKEAGQADPKPVPVIRFEIPRLTLDLEALDRAFDESTEEENLQTRTNSGILVCDGEYKNDGDDLFKMSAYSPTSLKDKYPKPGCDDNGRNVSPHVDTDNKDVQRLTPASGKFSNLRCTVTPSGMRLVTEVSSFNTDGHHGDGLEESVPSFPQLSPPNPETSSPTPSHNNPMGSSLGRVSTDFSGSSPPSSMPDLKIHCSLPKVTVGGSGFSSASLSPPLIQTSTAVSCSTSPSASLTHLMSKFSLPLPQVSSDKTHSPLGADSSTYSHFKASYTGTSNFPETSEPVRPRLTKSLCSESESGFGYNPITVNSQCTKNRPIILKTTNIQPESPEAKQNSSSSLCSMNGVGHVLSAGRGRGILAISKLMEGKRKCGEKVAGP